MPLSRHSPKLCPQTDINEKSLMVLVAAAAALNFQTLLRQEKHDFPLHFMVCWIFCFSCCIGGIMFMALEYSCGFLNASALIWHLPQKKFIASYTPLLWMLSHPQFHRGVLTSNNGPAELLLSWWGALPCALAGRDRTRRQTLIAGRGQPRPLALVWVQHTHLRK